MPHKVQVIQTNIKIIFISLWLKTKTQINVKKTLLSVRRVFTNNFGDPSIKIFKNALSKNKIKQLNIRIYSTGIPICKNVILKCFEFIQEKFGKIILMYYSLFNI